MNFYQKNKLIFISILSIAVVAVGVLLLYTISLRSLLVDNTFTSVPGEDTEGTASTDMFAASFSALSPFQSTKQTAIVTMNVNLEKPIRAVPKTVYGEGLLNFWSSDAFVHTSTFLTTVTDSQTGALRWPSAGHDNVPIFHFDNNHTSAFDGGKSGYLDPKKIGYTTKNDTSENIWDPTYNVADSAPATEQATLAGFVNVIKQTNTVPFMIFTWRSGELWRNIGGQRVMYRDPTPRTIDGKPMSATEAATLSSRQSQQLENRLMLKEYYAQGGPGTLIAQIGEELWSGWVDGQIPWDDVVSNPKKLKKAEWIAQTLKLYFTDLQTYAIANKYPVKFAVQFKESMEGGKSLMKPTERDFLRSEFNSLITNLGPHISYMTASVHYRGSWEQWIQEPQMKLAFMTDSGQGTLAEIRTWFLQQVTLQGYPNIDLIPHANSFGEIEGKIENPIAPWQIGLMASQYLIEAIKAGYNFTFGFPGFLGNYDQFANLDKVPGGIAGMKNGTYTKAPILYALSSIGEPLQHDAKLVDVKSSDNLIVTLGLLNTDQLHLYFINKHNATTTTSVDTTTDLTKSTIAVRRYSQTEMLVKIPANTLINSYPDNQTKLFVTLAPYSMTILTITTN